MANGSSKLNRNKFGLVRKIPSSIRRQVRQRDGFGCINCGSAFYQYDHFNPDYQFARSHEVEGIWLLCPGCHARKTSGHLSLETLLSKFSSPECKRSGFSWGPFDVSGQHPKIELGPALLSETETLFRINKQDLFSILKSEVLGGPFRINALFTDSRSQPVLRIVENEWQSSCDNWDVEVIGPRIIVRQGPGNIALAIRSEPPSKLVIERLHMHFGGFSIIVREKQPIEITSTHGQQLIFSEFNAVGCATAIEVDKSRVRIGVGCRGLSFSGFKVGPIPNFLQRRPIVPVRNSPCSCGSGMRFKKCHGRIA